jgi:arylsulfate sulfotransferase
MLDWRTRCTASGLAAYALLWLMGCGAPSSVSIAPSAVVLAPGQTFQFNISRTGGSAASGQPSPVLVVNGTVGGSASSGTITSGGLYTAPSTASGQITVGIRGQSSSATVTLFNPSSFTAGSIAATQNPLVASYSVIVPAATLVQVQFGLDTNYGFSTSTVQNPTGGAVTVLVAGMRADTPYHMQAVLELTNGSKVLDADHVFTTGSLPAGRVPDITVQAGTGTPSPGVELLSMEALVTGQNPLSAVATDLEGNVIWYYDIGTFSALPIKPLPNGHYLVLASPTTAAVAAAGVGEDIQEIDLAGNIITDLSLSTVNAAVSGIFGAQLSSLHHDVAALPNGHWILLVNYNLTINSVQVGGDALIDWDPQKGAVWTWSTFDHLSLSHAPYGLTDWTHSNAVVYSPSDGNLILSMRNQNWVLKINYNNGTGDGSILWTLGDGGSFTLPPGQAPIEWNYGQHYPTFVSPNTAGVISLMVFNDGNSRLMDSNNDVCGTPGVGACYSSVPIFQLDESAKTATVLWEENLSPYFSVCCGDALLLANGDMEVDIAFDQTITPGYSDIEEFTQTQTPELVWEMQINNQLAYRGMRIPSLYPDQIWPATLQSGPHRIQPGGSRSNGGDLR